MPAESDPTEVTSDGAARDPWAEQADRRRDRKRRRLISWLVAAAGVLLVVWIGVAVWVLAGRSEPRTEGDAAPQEESADGGVMPSDSVHSSSPRGADADEEADASTTSTRPTADSFVDVGEVWLLGHEDGTVDWGVIVESIAAEDRGPIRVDAGFRDEDGTEVAVRSTILRSLPAGGHAAVGGSLGSSEQLPVRVQVEVSVGSPLEESAFDGSGIELRSLARRARADGGEELTGFVVSERDDEVSALRLALLWRDATGAVVGSVFRDIAELRPGVEAHFTVPLPVDTVPDGLPTDTMWSRLDAGS